MPYFVLFCSACYTVSLFVYLSWNALENSFCWYVKKGKYHIIYRAQKINPYVKCNMVHVSWYRSSIGINLAGQSHAIYLLIAALSCDQSCWALWRFTFQWACRRGPSLSDSDMIFALGLSVLRGLVWIRQFIWIWRYLWCTGSPRRTSHAGFLPKPVTAKLAKTKPKKPRKPWTTLLLYHQVKCLILSRVWAFNLKVPGGGKKKVCLFFVLAMFRFVCACTRTVCVFVSVRHYSQLTFYYLEPKIPHGKGKIRIKDDIYIEKSHGLYLPRPRFLGPLNSELILWLIT